jgi:hypothetical protein
MKVGDWLKNKGVSGDFLDSQDLDSMDLESYNGQDPFNSHQKASLVADETAVPAVNGIAPAYRTNQSDKLMASRMRTTMEVLAVCPCGIILGRECLKKKEDVVELTVRLLDPLRATATDVFPGFHIAACQSMAERISSWRNDCL